MNQPSDEREPRPGEREVRRLEAEKMARDPEVIKAVEEARAAIERGDTVPMEEAFHAQPSPPVPSAAPTGDEDTSSKSASMKVAAERGAAPAGQGEPPDARGHSRDWVNRHPEPASDEIFANIKLHKIANRAPHVCDYPECPGNVTVAARSAPSPALFEAVRNLYYAGVWHCDRTVDEAALWTAVRDAAGFERGKSPVPAPSPVPRPASTAPKTGEHFVALNCEGIGFVCGDKQQPSACVVHYWENPGEEGFYPSNGLDEKYSFTHWMPLPAAPVSAGPETKG